MRVYLPRLRTMQKRSEPLFAQLTVSPISLNAFQELWIDNQTSLNWNCLFVTPGWLQSVFRHLGAPGDPLILAVHNNGQLIGIVPLAACGDRAQFLGNADVCDYQDIVCSPGQESAVVRGLFDYLNRMGIHSLELETLRPDAAIVKGLEPWVDSGLVHVSKSPIDVTFETLLPESWDGYLQQLNGKQRHEVRRKVRRLEADGPYGYRLAQNGPALQSDIATFLNLFQMNRKDKADFMDDAMSAYFSDLMKTLSGHDLLRLYFLELSGDPAAAVFCVDYGGVRYLYNSAYHSRYNDLSVGILSKVFSIRAAIETGCRQYDFLKGAESYKKRIGGQQVQLFRWKITW
jgi:CelD/BcsL family acetyltransferase involved in cellulose biosynthesis